MSPGAALDAPGAHLVPGDGTPLLTMSGIQKRFGGVHALRGASLEVGRGVVHALMGSNGSGKSTMLGILTGQVPPDEGIVTLDGEPVAFTTAADSVACGIAMVSQETSLALDLSVAENILLGRRLVRSRAGIDWGASYARAAEVLARLDVDYQLDAPARRLPPHRRQMVEIARAISMDARLVVLDEPTSSLTDSEVQRLLELIRRLKQNGVSVIFVSHRLSEVLAVADEVTVLREGSTVAAGQASEFDARSLVHAMVGEAEFEQPQVRSGPGRGSERLSVSDLSVPGIVNAASLTVGAGEIVGLAGLEGSGRSEFLEAIFGLRHDSSGQVVVDQRPITKLDPRESIRHRIGFVPPDRKHQGLVLSMSVEANLRMVATHARMRLQTPQASSRDERDRIAEVCRRFRLRTGSLEAPVESLSGGNQQKVAVAKWMLADPLVLLLDEPTRGVDIAAKSEIYQALREMAGSGLGILVSSSEYDELIELCDRILVMFAGRIVAEVDAERASVAVIARYAGGQQ